MRAPEGHLGHDVSVINTNSTANGDKPDERDFFCKVRDAFSVFARGTSNVLGTAWAFVIAILVIVVWGMTGPTFHYSDTWQLIINTGTTIVTFLMVFLIQNTQNRDAKAVHLKLDELIRALQGARNHLVDLEKLSDDELKTLEEQFTRLRQHAEKTVATTEVAAEKAAKLAAVS
ncbi:MAG: low affinity iron permease family protein [Chthoniobacterales bacterium]